MPCAVNSVTRVSHYARGYFLITKPIRSAWQRGRFDLRLGNPAACTLIIGARAQLRRCKSRFFNHIACSQLGARYYGAHGAADAQQKINLVSHGLRTTPPGTRSKSFKLREPTDENSS